MPIEKMRFEYLNPPTCPPKQVEKAAPKAKAAPKLNLKLLLLNKHGRKSHPAGVCGSC